MVRAPSARRGALWFVGDVIAWIANAILFTMTLANVNTGDMSPANAVAVIMLWWMGTVLIGIPLRTYHDIRLARRIAAQQQSTVR